MKARTKPRTLLMRERLARRMMLEGKEEETLWQQGKGFTGECRWDEWLQLLRCACLILNDLLLEIRGTTFQIDSLLLVGNKLYLYEVKNYQGNYYYEDNRMFLDSGTEIKNPFLQLEEAASALRRLVQELGYPFQVEAAVVFINPNFYLYQAPRDLPVIFPSQLEQHFNKLNRIRAPLAPGQQKLALRLMNLHKTENEYEKKPRYKLEELRKGLVCESCHSFAIQEKGHYCHCLDCGQKERTEQAVLKAVAEFHLLFPEERITKQAIFSWCQIIRDPKKVQRILSSHLTRIGATSDAYYDPAILVESIK